MEKLREYRLKNRFTNQFMADMLGISKPYYWQLEHNQKRLTYDLAIEISEIFHLKPDDLFYSEFKNKNWVILVFLCLIFIYYYFYIVIYYCVNETHSYVC